MTIQALVSSSFSLLSGACVKVLKPHVVDILRTTHSNGFTWNTVFISLNFFPKGPIENMSALVQVMAWRQTGHKPYLDWLWLSSFTYVCHLGPVFISDKTSYRTISWSIEVAKLGSWIIASFWNLTDTSAALLPMCLSNFKAIAQL